MQQSTCTGVYSAMVVVGGQEVLEVILHLAHLLCISRRALRIFTLLKVDQSVCFKARNHWDRCSGRAICGYPARTDSQFRETRPAYCAKRLSRRLKRRALFECGPKRDIAVLLEKCCHSASLPHERDTQWILYGVRYCAVIWTASVRT